MEVKKERVPGEKLNSFFSLSSNFLCGTVSYALDRSMYTASVGSCLCLSSTILSMIVCRASVQFEYGLRAYCVGEFVLWYSRCFMSCWLIIVSSSFAIIGRRDIGL